MRAARIAAALGLAAVAVFGIAVGLGGPRPPPPMASIDAPFQRVDFSALPAISRFAARDGTPLAYRSYPAAGGSPRGSVVLVHGSASRGQSLHPLAAALAGGGFAAYAIDVRGHGASGAHGRIAYVGQLEDDLEDLVAALLPPRPRILAGFSAGGGFALRVAGGDRRALFDGYLLLSPFLHQDASTFRPGGGGWVSIGVPRLVALGVANRLGVTWLNGLPVAAFALDARDRASLTPAYSYPLAVNFRPHEDYRGDARRADRPMELLVGSEDEVFRPERFAPELAQAGRVVPVTVVPGVGHMGLTLAPAGTRAVVEAVARLAAR
jgi:alpha-beta hydrolase superfamily lysophospholipase